MAEVFPGYTIPTVGLSVILPDGLSTGIVRSYLRYNGEGYFVCDVQSDVNHKSVALDVWFDTANSVWKSRVYNQIRYPDMDGVRKDM